MRQLEKSPPTMTESVDKSQVVIGGFEDLDGEETEKLVSDVLMVRKNRVICMESP